MNYFKVGDKVRFQDRVYPNYNPKFAEHIEGVDWFFDLSEINQKLISKKVLTVSKIPSKTTVFIKEIELEVNQNYLHLIRK